MTSEISSFAYAYMLAKIFFSTGLGPWSSYAAVFI